MKLKGWLILASAVFLAFAISALALFFLFRQNIAQILGYGAKIMCSAHFVSGRAPDEILAAELDSGFLAPVTIEVSGLEARARFLGMEAVARYKDREGCTLLYPQALPAYSQNTASQNGASPSWQASLGQKSTAFARRPSQAVYEAVRANIDPGTRTVLAWKSGVLIADYSAPGFDSVKTPQHGWSMTKSLSQALLAAMATDGMLDIEAQTALPSWRASQDPRSKITYRHLLAMVDGLNFKEVYGAGGEGVVQMLFAEPSAYRYAAKTEIYYPPGMKWHYSSASTNLVLAAARLSLDPGLAMDSYLKERLLKPLDMQSALIEKDQNGDLIGSSFGYASAEDWLKLGVLYLREGRYKGRQIIAKKWIELAKRPAPSADGRYGHGWWLNLKSSSGENFFPACRRASFMPLGTKVSI